MHLKELAALFVRVGKLARECGLVKLGTIAVDGTRVKANASRHKLSAHGAGRSGTEAQIDDALLQRAQATDAAERNEPEQHFPAEIEPAKHDWRSSRRPRRDSKNDNAKPIPRTVAVRTTSSARHPDDTLSPRAPV